MKILEILSLLDRSFHKELTLAREISTAWTIVATAFTIILNVNLVRILDDYGTTIDLASTVTRDMLVRQISKVGGGEMDRFNDPGPDSGT